MVECSETIEVSDIKVLFVWFAVLRPSQQLSSYRDGQLT